MILHIWFWDKATKNYLHSFQTRLHWNAFSFIFSSTTGIFAGGENAFFIKIKWNSFLLLLWRFVLLYFSFGGTAILNHVKGSSQQYLRCPTKIKSHLTEQFFLLEKLWLYWHGIHIWHESGISISPSLWFLCTYQSPSRSSWSLPCAWSLYGSQSHTWRPALQLEFLLMPLFICSFYKREKKLLKRF